MLRKLVAEAVGVEGGDALLDDAGLAERGGDPDPASRLPALVGAGDTVVGVVPRADPGLARRLLEGVGGDDDSGGGETVRLVFTGRAADRLTGPSGAVIRSVLAERGVEASRHDGDSPIGVLLVDDRAVVGLFDERGLAALLWSDAPAVREWAAATCRRYLAAAEPA
ncbi:hypothetical protein C469_00165 [Halorubrum lipolyticum DSM 21995]|uniref:Methanogenesis regulatory protein FilR1 middle domain-containing protein n=1 Tax=Halorubrum lipolyticum DSM 21995 TaxID=1227482 RepID=M0P499_9EURY|nr:hypothetical protein C469_00165 [Halorubrum lipolyticum DSM 21995]